MNCEICPRKCNVDRSKKTGFCKAPERFKVARASLHQWEEPCISGSRGSGTVFFSGCNLRCVFCQNYEVSHNAFGKELDDIQLMKIFDKLIEDGAHNLNLVTPSHYSDRLSRVLTEYKSSVPVVYNTSSYESAESLKKLEGLVDIYLPDLKYFDSEISNKYSGAEDYFEIASASIAEMFRQTGNLKTDENGIAEKGVLIRHMVLPGNISQSFKILSYIADEYGPEQFISVMSQYTPFGEAVNIKPIDRRVSSREYALVKEKVYSLGFENCFFQSRKSGNEAYIPSFNLEGTD